MKIVFLDAKTIGEDLDLSGYEQLGEVVKYGFSTKGTGGRAYKRCRCHHSEQGAGQRRDDRRGRAFEVSLLSLQPEP